MKLEWFDKDIIHNVAVIADGVAKEGAELVKRDAVRGASKVSQELAGQIKVYKNTYRDKVKIGYRVQAQAPGDYNKYFAIFTELGHYSSVYGKYKRPKGGGSLKGISPIHIEKKPYMRPALKRNKSKIKKAMQDKLK